MSRCEYRKFSKEFFNMLDEKLKIAKEQQFEICNRCKQSTIEELEDIMEYVEEESILSKNLRDNVTTYSVSTRDLRNFITKKIAELKGETEC